MIISLCSGYGGLDRAVAAAFGTPIAAHAEPEKLTAKAGKTGTKLVPNPVLAVLEARFPGVPNLGDITAVDWTPWRERCTILCAGFPCQPFSAAGRQGGEDDERYLWPSVHRAVMELAPEWVVLENVANIISIRGGEIWATILRDLREAGYDVAWGIFGACLVGACHHRHRMFLVARRGLSRPAERWSGKPCAVQRGHVLPTPVARDASTRGEGSAEYWETKRASGWTGGAPLGAELALLPAPVAKDSESTAPTEWERNSLALRAQVLDFLRTPAARDGDQRGQGSVEHMQRRMESGHTINLGDQLALLPTPRAGDGVNGMTYRNARDEPGGIAAMSLLLPTPVTTDARGARNATSGRRARSEHHGGTTLGDLVFDGTLLPTPRATDGTNGGPSQRGSSGDLAMGAAVQPQNFGRFTWAVDRWTDAFDAPPPAPTETGMPGQRGGTRMAAPFPEWMMGLRAGYVTDILPRNDALRAIGNGVMPQQGYAAINVLRELLG